MTEPGTPAPARAHPANRGARIAGLGAHRPKDVVGNAAFAAIGSSDAWLRARTGIVSRHRAAPDESVVDMAVAAAEEALAAAGVPAGDVGLVLMATSSNPRQTPGLAPELASRLGARGAGASDVVAGCAGSGYALAFAAQAVAAGAAGHALVVGAERLSDGLDPGDRATRPLFGDGAGALVVSACAAGEPGIGPVVWGSDGDRRHLIGMTRSWQDHADDPGGGRPYLTMQGQQLFMWAARALVPVARRACEAAGVEPHELAAFVPHQSNLPLVRYLARALGVGAGAAVSDDVVVSANTSAAAVPLALHRLVADGRVTRGASALLLGFGAGLTYTAQVVAVP